MLELIPYSSLEEKNKFLQACDFSDRTLIVPDLVSKLYWQDQREQKTDFINQNPILRAEDFWKTLLQRTRTDINFVSPAWMSSYLKQILKTEWLESVGLPYAKTPTLLKAMREFLPILSHPESCEIMEHWFDEVQAGQGSWRRWFELSTLAWKNLVAKNVLLPEWSASFLIQSLHFENFWNRNLVVDLGPELRTMEVELLQALASKNHVQVLTPHFPWMDEFRWVSYPYKQFLSRHHTVKKLFITEENGAKRVENVPRQKNFRRYSSMLGEIKAAISQIHDWVRSGKRLSEIALIAPDMEIYWPVLSVHLKKEGWAFEKPEKIKIGSLGSVVAWLAYLKKQKSPELSFTDLQLAEFHPLQRRSLNTEANTEINPETGLEINSNLISYSDLQSQWVMKPYKNSSLFSDEKRAVTASIFLNWAFQVWPHTSLLPVMVLESCQKWLLEAEKREELFESEWIEYLEEYLKTQEEEVFSEVPQSLGVYSLMNGLPLHRNFHFVLGCSEAQLKSSKGFVNGAEVLSLQHHTGHLLAHPDRDFREFQLRALVETGCEQVFCFPEADFNGTELVPSVFWMKGREQEISEKSLSFSHFHELSSWTPGEWEQELLQFERKKEKNFFIAESGDVTEVEERVPHHFEFSLSPASLKSYVECPFKFFAEKGLKLIDPLIVDLDLDARTQGALQHKLLELLTMDPFDIAAKRNQLEELIEQTLETQKEFYYSEKTRELMQRQLKQLGNQFLDHEENYRKEFPRFYTLVREAWFQSSIAIKEKKISFRGKIDRVDVSSDGQAAVVIDYKNDIRSYSHASSWIKNLEFQMPAYVQALESGSVRKEKGKNFPPLSVVAAHYYSLRDRQRKGFTLKEVDPGVVNSLTATGTLTVSEKNQILEEFQTILVRVAQNILEGDFRAIPHPKTDCQGCSWRNLCRTSQPNL